MTFVASLSLDGNRVENPTWDDVARAIELLDASTRTLVSLAPADAGDRHMAIGGGKDGLCVVYMTADNLSFWNLEDRTKSSGRKILIKIGGQQGDFREEQCVPRTWALLAAREYFDRGARAPDLTWFAG